MASAGNSFVLVLPLDLLQQTLPLLPRGGAGGVEDGGHQSQTCVAGLQPAHPSRLFSSSSHTEENRYAELLSCSSWQLFNSHTKENSLAHTVSGFRTPQSK